MKRERIVEHVAETQADLERGLETLLDLPIVGDVRDRVLLRARARQGQETRETFDEEESSAPARLPVRKLFERGLICRADDRGDPVVQVSPPLIAGQAEFDEIVGILGDVLSEARQDSTRGGKPCRPERPRLRSARSRAGDADRGAALGGALRQLGTPPPGRRPVASRPRPRRSVAGPRLDFSCRARGGLSGSWRARRSRRPDTATRPPA